MALRDIRGYSAGQMANSLPYEADGHILTRATQTLGRSGGVQLAFWAIGIGVFTWLGLPLDSEWRDMIDALCCQDVLDNLSGDAPQYRSWR